MPGPIDDVRPRGSSAATGGAKAAAAAADAAKAAAEGANAAAMHRSRQSSVLMLRLLAIVLAASPCASSAALAETAPPPPQQPSLDVELIADGLVAPLDLTFAPGDEGNRRFVVDQNGLVFILTPDGELLTSEPFLNITDRVIIHSAFDERGLLGFAFHPDFATNGRVYAHYSAQSEGGNICVDRNGTVPPDDSENGCPHQHSKRISEFTLSDDDPNVVDVSSERIIFSMEWPGRKHIGGGLAFGPDGYLYIGLGDGGWVHGPDGSDSAFEVDADLLFGDEVAQNLTTLFGKIIRIDVDGAVPYGIPPDNPFVGDGQNDGATPPEIYAWGFRNPFRISFDRNDYMYFGGSSAEVDVAAAASSASPRQPLSMFVSATADTFFEATYKIDGPGNFGWPIREGTHCIVRSHAYVPPETMACETDEQCAVGGGPQITFCEDGWCTCPKAGPMGEPIRDPIIEYLNFAVEKNESGLEGRGFGTASLGGQLYRGRSIPWLYGRFVQGDFAQDAFNGQIMVADPPAEDDDGLWTLRRAFVFDPSDPARSGFMKTIGQDAAGELYAITGDFTPTGVTGRVWKIVATSDEEKTHDPSMAKTSAGSAKADPRAGLWGQSCLRAVLLLTTTMFAYL